jgi:hypothetical protein
MTFPRTWPLPAAVGPQPHELLAAKVTVPPSRPGLLRRPDSRRCSTR